MSSYKELSEKIKALAKLTGSKVVPAVPDTVLRECSDGISSVLSKLQLYFPPTPQEKRDAKAHSISAQIINFTTLNAERKRFFSTDYFRRKFQALPEDRRSISATVPATTAAIRDAVILYYYHFGHKDGHKQLASFWHEIEADYKNSPAAKEQGRAKEFLEKLLAKQEVGAICACLLAECPTVAKLKEFAKQTSLTIPPQSKAKGSPRKTAHERLAEEIHMQGGVVRMRLE